MATEIHIRLIATRTAKVMVSSCKKFNVVQLLTREQSYQVSAVVGSMMVLISVT